jgi:hypothetical protein
MLVKENMSGAIIERTNDDSDISEDEMEEDMEVDNDELND